MDDHGKPDLSGRATSARVDIGARLGDPRYSAHPFAEALDLVSERLSQLWIPAALAALGAALSWLLYRTAVDAPLAPAPSGPHRVVLFGPNLNEMAAVLGHGARLVAITDYCEWPPALLELPKVGGQLDPDLEALALLRPDLLVLQGESPLLRSFAAAQGLAVTDLKMDDTIASILEGAVRLDRILGGDGTRGRAVAESLRAELDAIAAASRAGGDDPPTVLLVLSRDPDGLGDLFTAGAGTFLDELVEIAGGRSWARSHGRGYYDVALEALVADPPQRVIEIVEDVIAGERTRGPDAWRHLLQPPPVVVYLSSDGVLVPGPRVARTARRLRACIAGDGES